MHQGYRVHTLTASHTGSVFIAKHLIGEVCIDIRYCFTRNSGLACHVAENHEKQYLMGWYLVDLIVD